MRSKLPPQNSTDLRAEREQQLKSFIATALADVNSDRPDGLLVVARSPDSAACRAVFALADLLAARRIGALVVLTPGIDGEKWSLDFSPAFQHQARLAADHRVLDAHEQLVIGDRATWFGDSMRREADKRDAFQQFTADDAEIARRARATFVNLWTSCAPLYSNDAVAHAAAPGLVDQAGDAALAQDVLDTLKVWRPSSRH